MWSDVDFARNEIHVHAASESGTGVIKVPKTAAGVRDIPIHAALLPKLQAVQGEPFTPVFPTQAGTRQNASNLRRMWDSFCRALGAHMGTEVADDLTPYCLRHTFCTDLQRAGVPINVAKELMGHADIQTTANIYTHRDQGTLHGNMALLDGTSEQAFSGDIGGGNSGGTAKKDSRKRLRHNGYSGIRKQIRVL